MQISLKNKNNCNLPVTRYPLNVIVTPPPSCSPKLGELSAALWLTEECVQVRPRPRGYQKVNVNVKVKVNISPPPNCSPNRGAVSRPLAD